MAQTAPFDGVCRGPAGGTFGNSSCGTTRFGYPIRVKSGIASMQSVSSGQLEGPVGADGSVNIQAGATYLTGKFTNGHFAGTFSVRNCSFAMQYDKGCEAVKPFLVSTVLPERSAAVGKSRASEKIDFASRVSKLRIPVMSTGSWQRSWAERLKKGRRGGVRVT